MIIDHRHDDQRKDAEKTDVVEDRDDNDADEGEWVKGFSSRSVTMPPYPLSTTTLQCTYCQPQHCAVTLQCNTLYKHALKITDFRNSTLNTLHMFNMQSVR